MAGSNTLSQAEHAQVLADVILADPSFRDVTSEASPKAIILAGQPGAGKGNLERAAQADLGHNAVSIDPDALRAAHPMHASLVADYPYTWADHTHPDASQWAKELRAEAVAQRKNLIIDGTMPKADVIRDLQSKGYEVEVRAVGAHRFESELGVDARFASGLDRDAFGRYVPEHIRTEVYQQLPGALDNVAQQTDVPIRIYDRDGNLHFDSRTTPQASAGRALEEARAGRLTQERLGDLHRGTDAQRQWHRHLPERVPNDRLGPETAGYLLEERQAQRVEQGVQRLHNEVGGARAIRPTIKAAGVAGTLYGAYDAKNQVDAAIDTARSTREQWVRGSEETANQATKTVVTGAAATVGAIPGAAAGALTSPVTGPVGPVVGGLATGGAAAYGAEKLYEESRLQQFSKYLGREAGHLGYDYFSREGRLLREVNGLKEDLSEATAPAEHARIQGDLDKASAAFNLEAERNNRYFDGRAQIDQLWEQIHQRIPDVDKDDVEDALDRHIDAGKRPNEAVRGAFSDAVNEKYPRALQHEPLENYRALSNEQLLARHRQYSGEVAQDQRQVQALMANKDSRQNLDQGWPKVLAEHRQAQRVEDGLNELWRDSGHLGAVRAVMHERGLKEPVAQATRDPQAAPAEPTPEQAQLHQQARDQLGPGLRRLGMGEVQIDRVAAAAVSHAQTHAHGDAVQGFRLSKDGQRVALVQDGAPLREFGVREALAQPAEHHRIQVQDGAQGQARAPDQALGEGARNQEIQTPAIAR